MYVCMFIYVLNIYGERKGEEAKTRRESFHLEIMGTIKNTSVHPQTDIRPSTNLSIKYPRIGLPPSTAGCFQEIIM